MVGITMSIAAVLLPPYNPALALSGKPRYDAFFRKTVMQIEINRSASPFQRIHQEQVSSQFLQSGTMLKQGTERIFPGSIKRCGNIDADYRGSRSKQKYDTRSPPQENVPVWFHHTRQMPKTPSGQKSGRSVERKQINNSFPGCTAQQPEWNKNRKSRKQKFPVFRPVNPACPCGQGKQQDRQPRQEQGRKFYEIIG